MRNYPAENWQRLGIWIHDERVRAGLTDMKRWAARVDRSTRQMQGLERGERVGSKTLEAVARVLGCDLAVLIDILSEGGESGETRGQSPEAGPPSTGDTFRDITDRIETLERRVDELTAVLNGKEGAEHGDSSAEKTPKVTRGSRPNAREQVQRETGPRPRQSQPKKLTDTPNGEQRPQSDLA